MKVNIKKLPKGYSVVNGRIVKNMSDGGTSTGDQTNFGLVIQGYLVPDSLNKKLASENMQKAFSRSQIIFNNEIVTTTPGVSQTREEIRGSLGVSIKAVDGGIGYQIIGNNNQIA